MSCCDSSMLAFVALMIAVAATAAQPAPKLTDKDILNIALNLEYPEARPLDCGDVLPLSKRFTVWSMLICRPGMQHWSRACNTDRVMHGKQVSLICILHNYTSIGTAMHECI